MLPHIIQKANNVHFRLPSANGHKSQSTYIKHYSTIITDTYFYRRRKFAIVSLKLLSLRIFIHLLLAWLG